MPDLADRIYQAATECREVIREAHEATRDLNQAVKEARELIRVTAATEIGDLLVKELKLQVDAVSETLQQHIAKAAAKITSEFDRLGKVYLEGTDGEESIHELALRTRRKTT